MKTDAGSKKVVRILQVCYSYPPSFSGYGRQLRTVNSSILAHNNGIRICVITAFDGEFHKNASSASLRVVGVFRKNRSNYKSKTILFYLFCLLLPLYMCRELLKADLVHCVKAGPESAIAIMMARLFRKRVVVKVVQDEMRLCTGDGRVKRIMRRLRRNVIGFSDSIIAISVQIYKDLVASGINQNRIVNIPNCVNTDLFAPVDEDIKQEYRLDLLKDAMSERTVFLYMGSICKRKGLLDLMDALKMWPPNVAATFLFVGPVYDDMRNFCSDLDNIMQMHDNIKILYYDSTETPHIFMQLSDVFILPSYSEGMPNVVLEAFSVGLPVIASDIPVHKELILKNTGLLFRLGDSEDLLSKMLYYAKNQNVCVDDGKYARKMAVERYSERRVVLAYANLYSSVH